MSAVGTYRKGKTSQLLLGTDTFSYGSSAHHAKDH